MQEAEAQETPPPSPERANPFQFYYSPPFQFVAFSSPPLVLAGVAFQLGSRVISERRSLNVSSSGCRGRGRKKKKGKKRGGGQAGEGEGEKKKALQKQNGNTPAWSLSVPALGPLRLPYPRKRSNSTPRSLRSSWEGGGWGENGGEDAENKTPPGACRSPPPLRIKKTKNQVK